MFDLHAHVLPGVDDGPRCIEEALTVLAALVAEGVTDVVATARLGTERPVLCAHDLQGRTRALERLACQAGIAVRLYAAHELPLDASTEARLASGEALTIADGPYALLALPADRLPVLVIGTVERLRIKGFIPIIASAERYLPAQRDPTVLAPLVEAGALLQVSPCMLTGVAGAEPQRTARALLEAGYAHVFGSGIHGPRALGKDGCARYAEGLRIAESIVGAARVWQMVAEVPQAIVHGLPVHP